MITNEQCEPCKKEIVKKICWAKNKTANIIFEPTIKYASNRAAARKWIWTIHENVICIKFLPHGRVKWASCKQCTSCTYSFLYSFNDIHIHVHSYVHTNMQCTEELKVMLIHLANEYCSLWCCTPPLRWDAKEWE